MMNDHDEYVIHALTTQFYAIWRESLASDFRQAMDYTVDCAVFGEDE